MKVLVTGAGGFIGKRLCETLSGKANVEVFALSRRVQTFPEQVSCVSGDIMDPERVDQIFREHRFDAVVHLAAITEHEAIVDRKMETFSINLDGTLNLLRSFNRYCKGAQFLYASTGKVYGKTNEMPITENAICNPLNILGKSKRITEQVIDFYSIPENKYLICRIFNIYGEWQKRNFVVPTILDQLQQPELHLGNMKDERDYLYIEDLISALCACLEHREVFGNVDVVNIGSGVPTRVEDILREIESIIGRKISVRIEENRFRNDETPVEFCSHKKLTEMTGWTPKYSLGEGLRKTMEREWNIK